MLRVTSANGTIPFGAIALLPSSPGADDLCGTFGRDLKPVRNTSLPLASISEDSRAWPSQGR